MSPGSPAAGAAPWVVIGAKPAHGPETMRRLGLPYLVITDPAEGPVGWLDDALSVVTLPFRSDPMAVLTVPLPDTLAGVVSFTELGSLPATLLAEARGLPAVPLTAVLRSRDKMSMRRALAGHVLQPAFGLVGRNDPTPADFPVVVKPRDGSGSRAVEYVTDAAAYRRLAESRAGAMWETFVEGPEYSVEAVTFAGRHHVLGVTRKYTTDKPYFVESGHTIPAILPQSTLDAIVRCTSATLDAIGLDRGPSHTEVRLSDAGVAVIETHTRAGGDQVPLLLRLATGYDQLGLGVRSLTPGAEPENPPTLPPSKRFAAIRYLPWQDCRVTEVQGLDRCRALPGVVAVELALAPDGSVPVWRYSHERPGYVVVVGADEPEVDRRAAAALAAVVPVYDRVAEPTGVS